MTEPIPFQNWSLTQEQLLDALGDDEKTLTMLAQELAPTPCIDQDILEATVLSLLTLLVRNGRIDMSLDSDKCWYRINHGTAKASVNTDADLDQVWSAFKSLLGIAGQEIEIGRTLECNRCERNLLLRRILKAKAGP